MDKKYFACGILISLFGAVITGHLLVNYGLPQNPYGPQSIIAVSSSITFFGGIIAFVGAKLTPEH